MKRPISAALGSGSAWSRNAATKDPQTSGRATRSCGRLGPASEGTTAARSRSRTSVKTGSGSPSRAEEALLLRVALHDVHPVPTARERQVPQGLRVHREVGGRGAVLGAHVGQRGAIGGGERGEPVAEELDELAHHAVGTEHLREREDEVGGRGAGGQRAGGAHADHHRLGQEHRLAQHRGLGLDPADAPAQDAEAVHHRGVGIGAHQGVGEGRRRRGPPRPAPRCSRFT